MFRQSSITRVRPITVAALLAGLMGVVLAVQAIIGFQPAVSVPAMPESSNVGQAWDAVARRYAGLADYYAQQAALRSWTADAARWTGLAEAYSAAPTDAGLDARRAWNAMAARYEGLAQSYAGPADLRRSREADTARWTGLAQLYTATTTEPGK